MKVLLVTPPSGLSRGRVSKPKICTQPIGLAYLASVLLQDGHEVAILDAYSFGFDAAAIRTHLERVQPDLVGITSVTVTIYDAYRIAQLAKESNPMTFTVLGGPHPAALPYEVIQNEFVDFVIAGEGEHTLRDLCRKLDEGQDPSALGGAHQTDDGTVFTLLGHNSLPQQLDEIPFPAHHLLPDIRLYNPFPHWGKSGAFSAVITSRGCPYNCLYCAVTAMQKRKYRNRSPKNVIEELQWLHYDYGVSTFSFRDGTVATNPKRVISLCQQILEAGLRIQWNCTVTINEGQNLKMLKWMKRAGCQSVQYGIEVGDPTMLKEIKRLTTNMVEEVVRQTAELGIKAHGYFMFGLPGESHETMGRTIALAKRLKLHSAGFSIAVPYPGTPFYEWCQRHGRLKSKKWDEYDSLDSPVYEMPRLTMADLIRARRRAYHHFYLRPSTVRRLVADIRTLDDLKNYLALGYRYLVRL